VYQEGNKKGGETGNGSGFRKVDIRLPGKGNSNSHGARPVHQKHLRHDDVGPVQ
jgi:hypothetical protein